ncbi:cytochrome P450 [Streptomyces sp. TLI_146]|uniref:cytochrome P450 n=1 Tax=Streptomyces sp. TLI_146 TaxID=1938858 RepID=UPI000C70944F|nr:cytochrome P450 [Streptomyces sp. TLI_146]PKV77068.1 cytochrome P450 [Streptomyces sp. TLI_146]
MTALPVTAGLPGVLDGFDLTDHTRFTDGVPYALFARLRREAPLLFHPPGATGTDGEGFWVLTRYADIAAVAADPAFSAQGGPGRKGGGTHLEDMEIGVHAGVLLPMMDDPRHQVFKDMITPSLTGPSSLVADDELGGHAAELVDAVLARGTVDLVDELAEPYALRAVAGLFGAPEDVWDRLLTWVHGVVGLANRRTGQADDFSRTTFMTMARYFQDLLAAKRETPGQDFGSLLAHGHLAHGSGEPPLSAHEREHNFLVLLMHGYEQVRNVLAAALLALAEHPEQWQLLREDRSLVPGAIEELLRWTPPNPYNRRTATRDVAMHGQLIRAGDKVTLWWPSANRDESVFTDPDTFDVRRNPNPHLSFGAGVHDCAGADAARRALRPLLERLLDRVARIRPAGPAIHTPYNKHTVLLDLPVELLPA